MMVHEYIFFAIKLVAFLLGCAFWKKLLPAYRILAIQCILAFGFEAYGKYLNYTPAGNNVWLFNLYCLVELGVHGYIGYMFLEGNARKVLLSGIVILAVFWSYCFFTSTIDQFFNWYFVVHCFFLLIVYTAILLTKVLFNQRLLWKQSLFLVCISSILYYACTIPLFGMINYMVENNVNMAKRLFYISHVVDILRYSLIAIAFYLYGREAKRQYVQ